MAFDKVIDSAKLDGAITATANAIREKAETTEKIAWNPDTGFADAISAITVDPTKVTILREQTFAGFVVDPNFGAYSPGYVMPALFQLENGKTYYVNWDGTEYECVAYSFSYGDSTIVAIGNGSSLGLPSNNEPFLISYSATYDNSQLFSTEAKDSHTVGIWQKAAGGSSEDVRYVTFMSEDGTVELGKKAVATGDDCADPIARGVFSTPTKESTAQYNYTFYGWATTPNGAADSNWNKAVTEDRTVYANFVSAVRYYTITYYDSDGTTVLKTESLAYGATPSYIPTSDNYMFDKWVPDARPVTGNASYTAIWKAKPAFETTTWADIKQIADSGNADTVFAVGDTRTETITYADGSTEEITWVIADMNKEFKSSGWFSGKFVDGVTGHIAIVAAYALPTQMYMKNSPSSNFENSDLNVFLNGDFFNALPSELQSSIKEVQAIYGSNYISKVFLPCTEELGGATTSGSYGALALFNSAASRIRTLGANGSATKYWLRNYTAQGAYYYFSTVDASGAIKKDSDLPNSKYGVVPMFFL